MSFSCQLIILQTKTKKQTKIQNTRAELQSQFYLSYMHVSSSLQRVKLPFRKSKQIFFELYYKSENNRRNISHITEVRRDNSLKKFGKLGMKHRDDPLVDPVRMNKKNIQDSSFHRVTVQTKLIA